MFKNLRKQYQLCLVALGAMFFYLASLSNLCAAVYYVNTNTGFDSNLPGQGSSPATPWKTISYAIALAAAGDTIEVAAGTYIENLVFNKNLVLFGPNRNISPNGGARVAEAILQPPAPFIPPVSIGIENADAHIEITGFTLVGTGDYLLWANGSTPNSPSGSVKFSKNIVTGTGRINDGILYCNNILEVNVQDNRFANLVASGTSHALQIIAAKILSVKSNTFNNTNYAAIYAINVDSAIIERNVISTTTAAGIIILHGNDVQDQYTLFIRENTITNAGSMVHGGISLTIGNGTKQVTISHNRIQNCFYGVHIQNGSQDITNKVAVTYNWFSANSGAAINHAGIGVLEAAANWYGSPNGPTSPFNFGVSGTQRILTSNQDTLARFAPWLGTGTDADPITPGFQIPTSATLIIRSSWPQSGSGLLQRSNTFARSGDVLEFRDSVYINEDLHIDKSLSLKAGGNFTPRWRNLSVGGINNIPEVSLLSDFQVNNVNLIQGQGGKINTNAYTLRVRQNYAEAPTEGKAVFGTTVTSRTVNAFENNFGNISITFLETNTPTTSNIQVTRFSGTNAVVVINGQNSIAQRWRLEGNIPQGRSIRLSWPAINDNGVDLNSARLWFRALGSNTWQPLGRLITDTIGNPRTLQITLTQAGEFTVAPFRCRLTVDLGPDSRVCTNNPYTLKPSITGGTPPYNFQWSPAANLNSATIEQPIFQSNSLGSRTLGVTVTDAIGCQATDTIRLTLIQSPTAFAGRDTMICRGQILRLNA
ncbi:MAG: right-handed parallel beta-helix repeat-containing protein, partial [Bacteroidia bacterium]|nr:right-handed parallel beta-helix repeat-containing protein [Bacteroidia bacterium]